MGWQKIIENIPKFIGSILTGLFSSNRIKPTDSAIFDPFVPIGSVKTLEREYQADYSLTEDRESFTTKVQPRRSFWGVRTLVILIAAVLAVRLIGLQITRGQENFSLAEGNRLKTKLSPAPRGLLYDRSGLPLVKNDPSFSLIFNSSDYPKSESDRNDLVQKLVTVLGQSESDVRIEVKNGLDLGTVTLAEGLNRDQALSDEVKLFGQDAVEIVKSPTRSYGAVGDLGHLLGYIGKVTKEDLDKSAGELRSTDYVGKSGLEAEYDEILQGIPGVETVEVDARGRTVRTVGNKPPQVGRSIVLGLDVKVQNTATLALSESITKSQAKSGAAVVMDVNTGDIIALVSFPVYDSNVFSSSGDPAARQALLTDPSSPLVNRAIAGQYPSGSTIKPTVAAAGLEEKVITPSTKLDTSDGKITVGQWTFPDWKTHGITDVRQAIAESNNIFFYSVGGGFKQINGLGAEKLAGYLNKFGFGHLTGIDLPGEQSGLVPTPEWKKKQKKESWYIGDTYHMAIGQGDLLVTPLQLTRATAAIANGGKLLQPHLMKSVLRADGQIERQYQSVIANSNVVSDQTLSVVREGMRRAVESGSARSFNSLAVQVAAKTGTAQFDTAKEKTHSWFTAFAPYDHPQIAVTVIVEGGGEGYVVAAPVAKNIIEQYFNLPLTPITPSE